jgi:hypothetical protein
VKQGENLSVISIFSNKLKELTSVCIVEKLSSQPKEILHPYYCFIDCSVSLSFLNSYTIMIKIFISVDKHMEKEQV